MAMVKAAPKHDTVEFAYHTLRSVTSPEAAAVGRRRFCGIAPANSLFGLPTDEDVRGYLSRDEEGRRRKSTQVNLAIRATIENDREEFDALNAGAVIVARDVQVEDDKRRVWLTKPSIINGAQTMGVLEDYFGTHESDRAYPSVNFELLITDDEDLIADVSIARNFQNAVADLSIYGRFGRFDELERAMQKASPGVKLRKSETDFSEDYFDTEKLIQVLTAITPSGIELPSAVKRRQQAPETMYRVYAYRHRARCLKDFAEVMDATERWTNAHKFFLDAATDVWAVYQRLRRESFFSPLHHVRKETVGGKTQVALDGVPDGIVFPMLSALSRFMRQEDGHWRLAVPGNFPWVAFFANTKTQFQTTARSNPQTMGKDADCYVALHGSIEMFFAVTN
jgi:AIPR protein